MFGRVYPFSRKHGFKLQLCLRFCDFVFHPEHYSFADTVGLTRHVNVICLTPPVISQKYLPVCPDRFDIYFFPFVETACCRDINTRFDFGQRFLSWRACRRRKCGTNRWLERFRFSVAVCLNFDLFPCGYIDSAIAIALLPAVMVQAIGSRCDSVAASSH